MIIISSPFQGNKKRYTGMYETEEGHKFGRGISLEHGEWMQFIQQFPQIKEMMENVEILTVSNLTKVIICKE